MRNIKHYHTTEEPKSRPKKLIIYLHWTGCKDQLCTLSLNVRIKPSSLFNLTAGGCLVRSSPGLSGLVTPAEPTCTNLHVTQDIVN